MIDILIREYQATYAAIESITQEEQNTPKHFDLLERLEWLEWYILRMGGKLPCR